MASLCYQHSCQSTDLTFDNSLGLFSVVPAGENGKEEGESGDAEEDRGRGGEERREDEDGELVDLDESFGFSDSDSDDVIEMSSDEEEEESAVSELIPQVSELGSQVSELMLNNAEPGNSSESGGDLEIEQLKVGCFGWVGG